jgi:hypothetical protein
MFPLLKSDVHPLLGQKPIPSRTSDGEREGEGKCRLRDKNSVYR